MKHPLLALTLALIAGITLGAYFNPAPTPVLIYAGGLLLLVAALKRGWRIWGAGDILRSGCGCHILRDYGNSLAGWVGRIFESIRVSRILNGGSQSGDHSQIRVNNKSPILSQSRLFFILTTLLFVALGMLLINPILYPTITVNHISNFVSNDYRTIKGVVTRPVETSFDTTRMELADISIKKAIKDNKKWVKVKGRLRLTVYEQFDDIGYGDVIYFRGKIRRPRNFNNPGGFNYELHLKRKGISVTSTAKGREYIFKAGTARSPVITRIFETRKSIRKFIDGNVPQNEGSIIKGLLLGDRADIPEELLESYRRTGMSHILAISGMHVGILFIISFSLLYIILVRIPRLALMISVSTWAFFLSLIPIFFYTILSGMRITAIRSTLMITAYVLSVVINRERDILNTLALAGLLILIISPASLFDPAFQLSFVAVLSIILIYPLMTESLSERIYKQSPNGGIVPSIGKRLIFRVYQFATVSVSVLLGILPISAYYFFKASPLSIVINFAVVPLLGFIAVPLSFVSIPFIFSMSASMNDIATLILKVVTFAVAISNEIVTTSSSLFPGGFMVVPPKLPEIVIYYSLLIIVILYFRERQLVGKFVERLVNKKNSRKIMSRLKLIFITFLLALVMVFSYQAIDRYHPSRLSVTFISVGQGDSTLIQFPGGKTMLVDTGGFYGGTFDTGKLIVSPYLLHERIRKVDYLVLTHPEFDHYGGFEYILNNYEVGELWITERGNTSESIKHLLTLAKNRGVPIAIMSGNSPDIKINGTEIKFFHPQPSSKINNDEPYISSENVNNSSLVFRITYGDFSLLMTGDIEEEAESYLVSKGEDLRSSILKSPHHGSSTSSTLAFLRVVGPKVSVIMCGDKNRFGFPGDEALKRYEDSGVVVFRTDVDGAVIVTSYGDGFKIESVNGREYRWKR